MPDVLNLISRIVLSAVFIVYGYLAFADVKAWVNFNQVALKRFFDVVGGGMAPPTWFGYLIATGRRTCNPGGFQDPLGRLCVRRLSPPRRLLCA
jgi:hypothetical protein